MKGSGNFCLLLSLALFAQAKRRPHTPVNVQGGTTLSVWFVGLNAADLRGLFAAEGLTITFAAAETVLTVLHGRAQFSVASADQLILAHSAGAPMVAEATIFRRSPTLYISPAETGISRPSDFAGKTMRAPVAVLPSLRAMLIQIGVPLEQHAGANMPADPRSSSRGDIPVYGESVCGFVVVLRQFLQEKYTP